MAPIDTVMLNLRDSVSRIVYNLGFTNIEVGAHAKLVGLLADKLEAISHTSRGLLENSGRQAKGLTPVDLKHVFRMNRIDIAGLRLYTESVAPFPPTKSEIHEEGPITRVKKKDRLVDKTGSKPVQTPLQKHPTPPVFKFPIFDDMTDEQLGFGCDEEELEVSTSFTTSSKPPATILEPPPPPPPIPPLFFSPPPFATSYPPFLAADSSFNSSGETWPNFGVNYTTPDLTPPGLSYQVFATDPPAASENQPTDEPQEPEKSRAKYRKSAQKLEKVSSSSSISSAKMTKKRLMQTNYERRLRNEQMANEERKKERKYEKRRAEKEQIEKVKSNVAIIKEKLAKRTEKKKEKPDDYMPSLVLKLKPGAYEAIRKLERGELNPQERQAFFAGGVWECKADEHAISGEVGDESIGNVKPSASTVDLVISSQKDVDTDIDSCTLVEVAVSPEITKNSEFNKVNNVALDGWADKVDNDVKHAVDEKIYEVEELLSSTSEHASKENGSSETASISSLVDLIEPADFSNSEKEHQVREEFIQPSPNPAAYSGTSQINGEHRYVVPCKLNVVARCNKDINDEEVPPISKFVELLVDTSTLQPKTSACRIGINRPLRHSIDDILGSASKPLKNSITSIIGSSSDNSIKPTCLKEKEKNKSGFIEVKPKHNFHRIMSFATPFLENVEENVLEKNERNENGNFQHNGSTEKTVIEDDRLLEVDAIEATESPTVDLTVDVHVSTDETLEPEGSFDIISGECIQHEPHIDLALHEKSSIEPNEDEYDELAEFFPSLTLRKPSEVPTTENVKDASQSIEPRGYSFQAEEHGAREAAVPDHSAKVSSSTDINDNKLIKVRPLKRKLEETVVPEKMVVPREPLPKMRISFRRLKHGDTGVLIKKILTTTYYESNGEWKASERQWKSSNGVYSKPLQPHRPIRLSSSKSRIPKLKLIKNADNSYSKV